MTDLEDGVAALLEHPHEQTLHRQIVDRIAEECADPRRALLDLVIKHRASDGPRLAFAAWCEHNGEPQRAEFIRVQCELARIEEAGTADPKRYADPVAREYKMPPDFDRYRGLYALFQRMWDAGHGVSIPWDIGTNQTEWRRGFIIALEVTADTFFANADAVLSEHPVELVRLTTGMAFGVHRDLRTEGGAWDVRSRDDAKLYLEAMFPGVQFELPRIRLNVGSPTTTLSVTKTG